MDAGFSTEDSKDFFAVQAMGTRAAQFNSIAKTLHDTPTAEREVLQQTMSNVRNYNSEQGTETFCNKLSRM